MNNKTLLHITTAREWHDAHGTGKYAPPSLQTEGFIHLSTPTQVLATANRHYHGRRSLVLLCIDATHAEVVPHLRWEETPDGLFPHLYSALSLSAMIVSSAFAQDADGNFTQLPPVVAQAIQAIEAVNVA